MAERGRRGALARLAAGAGALLLAGCERLNDSAWFKQLLDVAEPLNQGVHRLLGRRAMAQEFSPQDLSPFFRGNGNTDPDDPGYRALAANGFADWRLVVDGLVERPADFSLAQLRAMPRRTQITRHDCVEGWSAIGQWTGVPLARVLEAVRPKREAAYVVFHCADTFEAVGGPAAYYESIDFDDAYHPQTILAYELNGRPLPVMNGAPLRLRVERQLGYKHAKYLMRLQLVEALVDIRGGNGGYWEDQGYQWYAGI
jgi:DMSO/TMAO reductase YedYZ molybdopterin-dependent catalytic subunit